MPATHSGVTALYINTTLKKSPESSHTQALIDQSAELLRSAGATTDVVRAVDHRIAPGVLPDMREEGWPEDEWPELAKRVMAADIVILAGPIWLGDQSSVMRSVIERLYGHSSETNEKGQGIFFGKVGGVIVSGNEDGAKHVASKVLYSLQHIGFSIPPQAEAAWLGPIGPGPSYLDQGSGGLETDFTNRALTFLSWNTLHLATLLKSAGGYPSYGNSSDGWSEGERYGFRGLSRAD